MAEVICIDEVILTRAEKLVLELKARYSLIDRMILSWTNEARELRKEQTEISEILSKLEKPADVVVEPEPII